MDGNKNYIKKVNTEASNKELEQVSAGAEGSVMRRYICINPACSMYLKYLPFQPPLGKCEECGQPIGEVL